MEILGNPNVTAAIVAILGALVGALTTHSLGKVQASDKATVALWRIAFDRPAFKGPYIMHSDKQRFREAIELTIQILNTGVLSNRRGLKLGDAKPKSQIRNRSWREAGVELERRLRRIRQAVTEQSGGAVDTINFDDERQGLIDILNKVLKSARLQIVPDVMDVETYGELYGD